MTPDTISTPEIPSSTSFQTNVTAESFEKLKQDVLTLDKDLKEAKSSFEKGRFDLITLLGVFVGIITYLGLEIQVFKTIDNPLLIIGISIFFIASILLFLLTIKLILKPENISWKDFFNPLYIILVSLLIISIAFILYGYKDFSSNNDNPKGLISHEK